MTVAELIAELQETVAELAAFPPEMEVYASCETWDGSEHYVAVSYGGVPTCEKVTIYRKSDNDDWDWPFGRWGGYDIPEGAETKEVMRFDG